MRAVKILVTGGAGFIGSHIVDKYIEMGHRVVVLDNLSTGSRRNLHPRAKFHRVDLRDAARIAQIVRREKPAVVNHHAAVAEVVKSVRDPLPTFEANVLGTVALLLAGGECGVRKFLFASTGGAIYGEPSRIPADESTPPTPLSPYGLSKSLGEDCIRFYARVYGFEYLVLRYPNVYGPRQNPKGEAGVVAIFAGLMRNGKGPTIFGDGTKSRDYVHVEDVARASVLGLTKGRNETLNLGWGRKVSDRRIFDTLARHLGYGRPPRHAPFRKGEVYQIALDATRARKVLGWRPTIPLDRGIRQYLAVTYPEISGKPARRDRQ